jgi:hypothetical protein
VRCACGCLSEWDEKGKQQTLHSRFCPESIGDYARAQRFDERYGKRISDMVEDIYAKLGSQPTQEQVRELQGREYVPLMNLFNKAQRVTDRSETCVQKVLAHFGQVICKLNQQLGKLNEAQKKELEHVEAEILKSNQPSTFIFVVDPQDEDRFRGGHMRPLHERHTITTKVVSERKLIAIHDCEYNVSQMALHLGGFNIHMAQNRHRPELQYRIGVLIPNHSGLK